MESQRKEPDSLESPRSSLLRLPQLIEGSPEQGEERRGGAELSRMGGHGATVRDWPGGAAHARPAKAHGIAGSLSVIAGSATRCPVRTCRTALVDPDGEGPGLLSAL